MLPNQFNPAFVGQQGLQPGMLQQQHSPNQVDTTQSVPGLSNPEQRIWQQMQQNARIAQFRQQMGGEMAGGPVNQQQMIELLRERQNHQQAQKQHQPFGLGGMNPGASTSFHDPSSQPGFPINGNNMQMAGGNNNFNVNALQAMAAARNREMNMLQTLQGGGSTDLTRQINMLGMAHTQRTQEQPAGNNFATLRQLQQQQPQQHPLPPQHHQMSPPQLGNHMNAATNQMGQGVPSQMNGQPQGQLHSGFFGNAAMAAVQNGMRSSPPQANMQVPPGMRPPTAAGGNRLNITDLRNRAEMVQKAIKDLEARRQAMVAQGSTNPQAVFESNNLRNKILEHQQLLQRIARMIQMTGMPQQNGAPGDMSNGNHLVAPSPIQQPQQVSPSLSMQQPNWLPQSGPSPPNNFPNPQMNQQGMTSRSPQAPNMQPANSGQSTPALNRGMPNMNGLPNRSMTTPLQMLNPGAQNPPQTSPNMANMMANQQFVPGTATAAAAQQVQNQQPGQPQPSDVMNAQRGPTIQPLPKSTFLQAFRTWTTKQGIPKDERLLSWENRQIDLYALHCEVIKLGGAQRATTSDQWPYIGAKLGFVNFPGTDTEPARAGPGVAQHLQHVYKEFLAAFDSMYIGSMIARQRGMKAEPGMNQPQAGPSQMPGMQNNISMQNGQPMPGNAVQTNSGFPAAAGGLNEGSLHGISQLVGVSDPQQIQHLLQWSMLSNEKLRQQGVPPHLVDKVELHRAILQRTYQGQIQKNTIANFDNPSATVSRLQRFLHTHSAQMKAHAQQQQQQQHPKGLPGQVQPVGIRPDMPQGMPGPQEPQQNQVGPSMDPGTNDQVQVRRTRPTVGELQRAFQFATQVMRAGRRLSIPTHSQSQLLQSTLISAPATSEKPADRDLSACPTSTPIDVGSSPQTVPPPESHSPKPAAAVVTGAASAAAPDPVEGRPLRFDGGIKRRHRESMSPSSKRLKRSEDELLDAL
ncbi:hypothetical protein EUX98_g7197 [Antrodiella citrinella]|uniref:ARID domain-containing protein n=1 Tax=Antrodiella citrinella TaxID=2447956 RepID=A0A4S4MUI2_9APHY|nr:hypothetical protein EUX98_g7197 [Antrodiella citrinella]